MNYTWADSKISTRLLLLAGVAAAVCWSVADMLLVGFVQLPQRYPLFSQTLSDRLGGNVGLAMLMLDASPLRLLWGVLPATFSVIFYLAAAVGVYRLMMPGRSAFYCTGLLLCGYALSPLGHAGFYYIGISAQTLLHSPPEAYSVLLLQLTRFGLMLKVHWWCSVALSGLGWLVFGIQTVRKQTLLPRWMGWCNPLPVGLFIGVTCSLFPDSVAAAILGGATLNLAQLIFFLCAYCLTEK